MSTRPHIDTATWQSWIEQTAAYHKLPRAERWPACARPSSSAPLTAEERAAFAERQRKDAREHAAWLRAEARAARKR